MPLLGPIPGPSAVDEPGVRGVVGEGMWNGEKIIGIIGSGLVNAESGATRG